MSISARISRLMFAGRTFLVANYERARNNPKRSILVLAVFLAVVALFTLGEDVVEAPATETRTPTVTLTSVAELSSTDEALILLGEVRSMSQAELRTQTSGEVTRVNVSAGQYVGAGTILAEIENASERAGVLSAQGALVAAEASLARVYAGARTEDRDSAEAQAKGAVIALATAEESARAVYSQSYSLAQDAIFAKADDFFTNTYTVRPSFRVRSASYDERRSIENERVAIGEVLEVWKEKTFTTLDVDTLDTALTEAQRDLARIKSFLDTISVFVSEQTLTDDYTETDKSAQESVLLGARSSIDGARASVAGARQGLASALSAEVSASGSQSKITAGDRPEDVRVAEAGVLSARGAYAGALAGLERTLIRSPIAGTVTTLNISVGDFVNAFEGVAVVANPGALEAETYVSAVALDRIAVGMPVLVSGAYEGVVTSRAPGLDPSTKKARVTVSVPDDAPLVNGSFVEIAVSTNEEATAPSSTTARDGFAIPITAIKVLPRGLAVFTVNESNELEVRPISEGPIVGEKMFVKEGLTPELLIVTDVRGLKEGDLVTVNTL